MKTKKLTVARQAMRYALRTYGRGLSSPEEVRRQNIAHAWVAGYAAGKYAATSKNRSSVK